MPGRLFPLSHVLGALAFILPVAVGTAAEPPAATTTGHAQDDAGVQRIRQLAERGDTYMQCRLASMYRLGQFVPKDLKQAAFWYRKAADAGDAFGQFELGMMYLNGDGLAKDAKQGAALYRKAADQGLSSAQYYLAQLYQNGEGVEKDEKQATAWYLKAAEQGDTWSEYRVGIAYERGVGIERNIQKAREWYGKAVEKGDVDAMTALGETYAGENPKRHLEFLQKAADRGGTRAQAILCFLYEFGNGAPKDLPTAYMWANLAAASGERVAADERDSMEKYMTRTEIEEGQRLTREWLKAHQMPTTQPEATSRPIGAMK